MTSPPKVQFILQVEVAVDPKDADTFLEHFRPIFKTVLAEPECAYFLFSQDLQEPGVFRWTEGWTEDAQWFMTKQFTKDYYGPYLKGTEPLFIRERIAKLSIPLESLNAVKVEHIEHLA